MSDIYTLMQNAVDVVGTSPHPANKIAATLTGKNAKGEDFSVLSTNFWPAPIARKLGADARIGNSSGTVHAETACILRAPKTADAALFVTDLPCPNCVKNMAEAGIKDLYIDHKGFDKDYAQRRGHHFTNMSMQICETSGISVYKIFRKDKKLEPILQVASDYKPPVEKPQHMEPVEEAFSPAIFSKWIKKERLRHGDEPYAVAFTTDADNNRFMISAAPHPVIGYTSDTMEDPDSKYSFILQPVNRILMTAARKGLRLQPGYFYSSIVPTSRELVNVVGAEIKTLMIGDMHAARDAQGPQALAQLQGAGILDIS